MVVWEWLFSINLWWAHVTETPEVNKIIVFNKGIWNGLNGVIPIGGQFIPNSILGDRLLWKKLQKKETKKKISETINKIIPHFNPLITQIVWRPWKVPSREISRHHWYIVNNVIIKPKINKFILYWWNHFTNLQAYEYIEASFSIADSIYGSTFFIATGFHGLHVLIGTTFLLICFLRHIKFHFSSSHHFGFEAAAWYWHFVDVVWLFLYISIYWWGG